MEVRHADLGTNWEQDWRYQTNATTMSLAQGGIVRALKTRTFNITATSSQYQVDGRKTGLKIRSSQEGVGSSPIQIHGRRFTRKHHRPGDRLASFPSIRLARAR